MLLRYLYFTDGGRVGVRFDELPQSDREADRTGLRSLLDSLLQRTRTPVQLRETLPLLDFLRQRPTSRAIAELLAIPFTQRTRTKRRNVYYRGLGWPIGHFFRHTYEVTKRDERPDEIVVRVDFVEQHKP